MGLAMQHRQLEPIDFREGGESVVRIYKDNYVAGIGLLISGLLDVTVAATYHEDAPHRLIDTMQVQIKSNKVMQSFSGRQLYELVAMTYETAPDFTLPDGAVGNNKAFSMFLPLDFIFEESDLRGLLDPAGWSSFDLKIKWGRASDLITAGTVAVHDITIDTELIEAVRSVANQQNKLMVPYLSWWSKRGTIVKDVVFAGTQRIELPVDTYYRGLMIVAKNNGVRSDGFITNVRMDLAGGTFVYDKPASVIRARNRLAYEQARETGVYFVDFDPARNGNGWVNTNGLSSAYLEVETGAPVGTSQLIIVPIQAVPASAA